MQWIRWWGLGVFAAVVGGLLAVFLLFADTLVRWTVEAGGTRAVGAQVEVAEADVGFSPARLELQDLAVTNPDEPMRNAVEIERVAFDIDWIGVLVDRVHIDDLALEGVRFGTERETSGAIARTERAVDRGGLFKQARERAEIPPLEVPSADKVLERESLRSPAVISEARSEIEQRETRLSKRVAELPGDEQLQDYRQRLDEATADGDTVARLKAAKELRDLSKAIRDDLDRLKAVRKETSESVGAARRLASEAGQAPQNDIDRLYRKYTDPKAVAGELAHYLLGPKVEDWLNQSWYWYDRISPYLGSGAEGDADGPESAPAPRRPGRNVVYPEAWTEPRLLVRRVALSGAARGGELDGRITDIAAPATRWGEPLRLDLTGAGVAGVEKLQMAAIVDRRSEEEARSELDFDAAGANITGLRLGADNGLRAEQGRADFRVQGSITGGALDLELRSVLQQATFRVAEGTPAILGEVATALGDAGNIDIGADIGGTLQDPTLDLTSSLDELLGPLLRQRLEESAGGFRDSLTNAITQRTEGPLQELNAASEGLQAIEGRVQERINAYEGLRERVKGVLDR